MNQSGIVWRLLIYYSKITKEFFRSTVLNGLKYLTFKYLTICEKLFFLCCLIFAFYGSFHYAARVVEKWQTSPVLIVMNPKATLITDEPFPAITICNMNRAKYDKVKDFDKDSLDYAMLQKICKQKLNYTSYAHLEKRSDNHTFLNFVLQNSQNCSELIVSCMYGNVKRTCTDLFQENPIDDGLCCTFNLVHQYFLFKTGAPFVSDVTNLDGLTMPVDWSTEKGYPRNLPKSYYPRTPTSEGILKGLTVILNGDLNNYYCSSTNGPGFKVVLHSPIDIPHMKTAGLSIHMGLETSMRIGTKKEEAAEILKKSTDPKERHCYFSGEHPLICFRHYTRRNCELECRAKFILRKCNCIPYYMPKVSDNATECHVKHFNCVVEVEKGAYDQTLLDCQSECLPNCNTLSYSAKPFFLQLNNDGFGIKSPLLRNMSTQRLKNYAVLNIFYSENHYRGNVKHPSMGFTEISSQVGGILSLMMGFSIISLVELVYFFVIKPLIKCWRYIFKSTAERIQQFQNNPHYIVSTRNELARPQLPPYSQNMEQLDYVN